MYNVSGRMSGTGGINGLFFWVPEWGGILQNVGSGLANPQMMDNECYPPPLMLHGGGEQCCLHHRAVAESADESPGTFQERHQKSWFPEGPVFKPLAFLCMGETLLEGHIPAHSH